MKKTKKVTTKTIWNTYKRPIILLISIIIGTILGLTLKEEVTYIKPLGDIFVNLMFTIVVPLIFFLIASTLSKINNQKKFKKVIKTTILVFLLTSFISSIFMLLFLTVTGPVNNSNITLEPTTIESISIGEKIVETFTVSDFNLLLSKSHLLPLIVFSILIGLAASKTKEKGETFRKFLEGGSETLLKVIDIIMYYAPIGLCAYFANLVVDLGPELIGDYAKNLILYIIACIIYYIVFYTIYTYIAKGKKGIKLFWKHAITPTATSLATCSSVATMPANIEAAKKMEVEEDVYSVSLPLGAAMHMEGSSMGTVLKIMFLFTIFGKDFFTVQNVLITILFATFICTAMSGVPSGGLISEMLILSIFNFPTSAYPLLALIAWLIDAPATCLNATGDTASTMLIEKIVNPKNKSSKRTIQT